MVTISRIRTEKIPFWASIRFKILLAFFVVVGTSFLVAATRLTGVVSDYLTEQRTREDTQAAESLAAVYGPLMQSADSATLTSRLKDSADGLDGRLLLLDTDGKVQFDSMRDLCGQRLRLAEVVRVLVMDETSAYGMHREDRETVSRMTGETEAEYVAYGAHEMVGPRGRNGVLLYVSRIQGMMDSMYAVSSQLNMVFIIIAVAALALALILSQVLTTPIVDLSRTMRKMGRGDLSVRVQEKGGGELRQLAENYNTMAAQLENLDKSRNQFVSNASHELKTPLATMKILLETMMYQPDMPEEMRQEFMGDMNHEIDRLTGIITDLLTLTRVDTAGGDMKREEINMTALTGEVIRLLAPAAEKRGQLLAYRAEPGLTMTGDRNRLSQVLYNLTDNAMKYTQDGGSVQVSLTGEGEELVWRVRDNGVGIPLEDQEHIFDRFYRVDKARSRETGGTGLGLSIVRQLVNMHGGTVSVESEPGAGSCFTVRLPKDGKGGERA
ncbi:MAG: HAMP domain-containing protein [Clostridia bacterium]|nr:HAMP domain-containing protein [Clostridia bacterium]